MPLAAEQMADLLATTENELGRYKWTDLTSDLQKFFALKRMMKKRKVKVEGGPEIEFNIMVSDSGAAKHVGMYEVDTRNVTDVMQKGKIPWRHTNTNYQFDEREIAMNASAYRIVDLVKVRRTDAMVSLAKLMEDTWWSKPVGSTDVLTPYGLLYWIVKYPTSTTTLGFSGGNPAGFTSGYAGVSSSTWARWANYTGQWTAISKADLVAKMRKTYDMIHFESPVEMPTYAAGKDDYTICTDWVTKDGLQTLVENQNDSLGFDLDPVAGKFRFRGVPVAWVPKLDADAAAGPVYFINWAYFNPVFLRGWYLKRKGPKQSPLQHTVFNTDIDTTWNTKCTDRRRQAVLSKTDVDGV